MFLFEKNQKKDKNEWNFKKNNNNNQKKRIKKEKNWKTNNKRFIQLISYSLWGVFQLGLKF